MVENEFYIEQKDWNKLQNYARSAYNKHKAEIGGMCVAVQDDDGDWEIKDPVILKQEISASNCILDKDALALYYTKIGAKMKKKTFRFVWWHSHHTMKAFWSATDLKAIEEYSDGDFSFSLVINLKEEYVFRVSIWKPIEMHEDIEISILNPTEKKVPKRINDEVDELCSQISSPAYGYNYKANGYGKTQVIDNSQTTLWHEIQTCEEYNVACKAIDMLNTEYVKGTIDYEVWSSSAKSIEAELETKYKGTFLIPIITEEELDSRVHFDDAVEFMEPNFANQDMDPKAYKEWLEAKSDNEDYRSYNSSFGLGHV